MAGQSRKVKNRITATKKTAQITKAMYMVSTSKLRSAERAIKEYLPFIEKARDMIAHLASADDNLNHPLMEPRSVQKVCYVMLASDRGLAGAFNTNVFKTLLHELKEHPTPFCVYPLGLKAYAFAKKMHYPMVEDKLVYLRDDVDFHSISEVIRTIVMEYLKKAFDKVVLIYNHYINTITQTVVSQAILPVSDILNDEKDDHLNYEFEGGVKDILDTALPIYIENSIYSFILDSKASEHAARMNSMKNATDNATDVIATLELLYNRARQAAITLELTDIVGGASVVNEN